MKHVLERLTDQYIPYIYQSLSASKKPSNRNDNSNTTIIPSLFLNMDALKIIISHLFTPSISNEDLELDYPYKSKSDYSNLKSIQRLLITCRFTYVIVYRKFYRTQIDIIRKAICEYCGLGYQICNGFDYNDKCRKYICHDWECINKKRDDENFRDRVYRCG